MLYFVGSSLPLFTNCFCHSHYYLCLLSSTTTTIYELIILLNNADPSQLFFCKAQSKITVCLRAEGSKRVRNVSMHASARSDYEVCYTQISAFFIFLVSFFCFLVWKWSSYCWKMCLWSFWMSSILATKLVGVFFFFL